MSVHSIQKIKEAKVILPQLENILKVFDFSIKALTYYKAYIPVAKAIIVLKEQMLILNSYKEKYKEIENSKGSI